MRHIAPPDHHPTGVLHNQITTPSIRKTYNPFRSLTTRNPFHRRPIVHPLVTPPPHSDGPLSSGVNRLGKERSGHHHHPPPTLRHIVPEDLHHTDRLLALFQQAQRQGLIGTSDSDRLTFVSLAEHARVVGAAEPLRALCRAAAPAALAFCHRER